MADGGERPLRAASLVTWSGTLLALGLIQPVLTPFQRSLVTEMMIWSIFALAYNLLFGYTGLVSLGHGLFFGAGMYAAALSLIYLGADAWSALAIGGGGATLVSAVIGYLSIRVRGLYFLIVTLIFSMTFYLAALNYPEVTGGSGGLVLTIPNFAFANVAFSILDPVVNFYLVLIVLGISWGILARIGTSPVGKVLQAVRENEERTRLLGYNVERYKLFAFIVSGLFSGLAGALYAFSFRFAGPQFMDVVTSVNVLVWTLVGGAGTVLGPVVGTFLMVAVVDYTSSLTSSFLIVVGAVLLVIVSAARKGIVGTLRSRLAGHHG